MRRANARAGVPCGLSSGYYAEWVMNLLTDRSATQGVSLELLPQLRRARDHMDVNYPEPIDLSQLAAVAGISKYYFARSFEAAYGESPIRYLTRRRIERAQDLLRSANLTVTEICMLVGFTSLGSFSARFTKLVGETPTSYRDKWAAAGGPWIPGCYLFMRGAADPRCTARSALTGAVGLSHKAT